jgi:hypothetical protein
MSIHQTPTSNIEEAWIVKYRAALNAAAMQQSRAVRLRAALSQACSIVVLRIGRMIETWMYAQSFVANPTLQPKSMGSERIRVPMGKSNRSAMKGEGSYKKAS